MSSTQQLLLTEGGAGIPNYIEDVFSTYLYTGNGTTQQIVNGIDLSTKGGLIWTKSRSNAYSHALIDTARGGRYVLQSNSTSAPGDQGASVVDFNTNGYTWTSTGNSWNNNVAATNDYVGWTFRKQPKFFDVVTYTGNGSSPRAISHLLGSTPGCVIVKRTDTTGNWFVYHRSSAASGFTAAQCYMYLNLTNAVTDNATIWGDTAPTDTTFTVGSSLNTNGATYVAYIYAHNAGGFGLTGTDNVISCGSFTTDGSGNFSVNLGYEPQWLLIKNSGSGGGWYLTDNMRGLPAAAGGSAGPNALLFPNNSNAENTGGYFADINATGFQSYPGGLSASDNYIYIAIRRGPMKVPTDATKVFKPNTVSSDASAQTTNFPVDMFLTNKRTGDALNTIAVSKLTSNSGLVTSSTAAEAANYASATWWQSNTSYTAGVWGTASIVDYAFQRAPSFFDEVCYTSTGASATFNHNLAITPELIITRFRSNTGNWIVGSSAFGSFDSNDYYMTLNTTNAKGSGGGTVFPSAPTSTQFTIGSAFNSGYTCVAYLFATCSGVSKVGSYTGNGSTQAIACGFTGGARFVLIKRTDSAGGWYVYDTARGMTLLTDPYLFLNSTAAESATLGSVTTTTGGFTVDASILAAINTNAASYVFLAIA